MSEKKRRLTKNVAVFIANNYQYFRLIPDNSETFDPRANKREEAFEYLYAIKRYFKPELQQNLTSLAIIRSKVPKISSQDVITRVTSLIEEGMYCCRCKECFGYIEDNINAEFEDENWIV